MCQSSFIQDSCYFYFWQKQSKESLAPEESQTLSQKSQRKNIIVLENVCSYGWLSLNTNPNLMMIFTPMHPKIKIQ